MLLNGDLATIILLVLAAFLVFIGYQLPHWFVYYAEVFVGVVLIYLGIRLWRMVSKQGHDIKNQSHEHTLYLLVCYMELQVVPHFSFITEYG